MWKIIGAKETVMKHHTRSVRLIKCLAGAAMLAPIVGCYENSGHHSHHQQPTVVEERTTVYQPAPAPGPNSAYWYDHPRYAGAKYEVDTRERHHGEAGKNVPKSAHEERVGKGIIAWTPSQPSYVWITDSEHDAVMWSGRVWPGEAVEVVPKHNRIFVGQKEVARFDKMKDDIRYRIWSDQGKQRF
jgi:hypothetical protein